MRLTEQTLRSSCTSSEAALVTAGDSDHATSFFMQFSKKIPLDNPTVLNAVRAVYVISNLLIAGLYFYVQQQINKKKGTMSSDIAPVYPACRLDSLRRS